MFLYHAITRSRQKFTRVGRGRGGVLTPTHPQGKKTLKVLMFFIWNTTTSDMPPWEQLMQQFNNASTKNS